MVGTVGLEYEYEYDHPIVGVVSDLVILTWQRQRAKVNLAIWTLDTALGDVVWRTRQPRLPLPYVVTPVVLVQENRLPHGDVVVTDEDDVNSNILVIIITTFGVTGQLHPQIRVIGQVHGVREANGLVRTRLVGVSTHVEVECFIVVFDDIVLDIIVEAIDWFTNGAHVRHVLLDWTRVWSFPLQRELALFTSQPHGSQLLFSVPLQ